MPKVSCVIVFLTVILSVACAHSWDGPVRGSWVRDGGAKTGDVTLAGPGGACEIVVEAGEHTAVRQAARFLAEDIFRISGKRPSIVGAPSGKRATIHLRTLYDRPLPAGAKPDGLRGQWEAYQVLTAPGAVWCIGSNLRGTAFAAYTLSERLGVDPLYQFTGVPPEKRPTLVMRATNAVFGPPTFKYRGLSFPRRFPDAWYKRLFETSLRLRMNQVAPFGHDVHPYTVQQMASAWGLFYTSKSDDTLLSNPYGFETLGLAKDRLVSGAYDFPNNRGGVLRYWQAGAIENQRLETIYPLGLFSTDGGQHPLRAGAREDRAAVWADALREQARIVKEATPGRTAPMSLTLRGEAKDIHQAGRLDVPEGVTLVWEDDGQGTMASLPNAHTEGKHGVLYHLAPVVTTERIEDAFRKVVAAGATESVLVEVADLGASLKEARFVAGIAWDAGTALSEPAGRYTEWWEREYGGRLGRTVRPPALPDFQVVLSDPARDRALAEKYAPIIRFDEKEPFFPVKVGYAVVRRPGLNAGSTYRLFNFATPDTAAVIEYAVYWDWDIQHLYELEHVWVHVGNDGRVAFVEATAHGNTNSAWPLDEMEGTHPVLFSEPGKHAFSASERHYTPELRAGLTTTNRDRTGTRGLLIVTEFSQVIRKTPEDDALVAAWLKPHAWEPTFRFTRRFRTADVLAPWPEVFELIPRRVEDWMQRLREDTAAPRG